jgi:hypothetical protein
MKKASLPILWAAFLATLFLSAGFIFNSSVTAAPVFQLTPFPTPTAGPDGRILYQVQLGDTLWRIAAVAGISIDELRILNGLDPDEVITVGQVLLLGLGGPAGQPTDPPPPGATPVPPTPTEAAGGAIICVLLFEDTNGDALRQEEEFAINGGAVSINERTGLFANTGDTTDEIDPETLAPIPVCFQEVPTGSYTISVAIPDGYNPTTTLSVPLEVQAGDSTTLNFGAQLGSEAVSSNLPVQEGGRSPMLGVLGFALLLAGVGLGVYSLRAGR